MRFPHRCSSLGRPSGAASPQRLLGQVMGVLPHGLLLEEPNGKKYLAPGAIPIGRWFWMVVACIMFYYVFFELELVVYSTKPLERHSRKSTTLNYLPKPLLSPNASMQKLTNQAEDTLAPFKSRTKRLQTLEYLKHPKTILKLPLLQRRSCQKPANILQTPKTLNPKTIKNLETSSNI